MNPIKLPVRIYQMRNSNRWAIVQADDAPLRFDGDSDQAHQIAIALNWHDELVAEIKGVLHDAVKYPQLKIHDQTKQRLERLLRKATP